MHRFVVAVVDVGGIFRPRHVRGVGNVSRRARGRFGASDALGLFQGRRAPESRDEIGARFAPKEVRGHHRKLRAPATLREEDLKRLGNREKFAKLTGEGFDDRLDGVRAVRHLHDRGAEASVVEKLPLRGFEHGVGKHPGTGGKIPNLRHFFLPLSRNGHVVRVRLHQDC